MGFLVMALLDQQVNGFWTLYKFWALQNTDQPDFYILEEMDNDTLADYDNEYILNSEDFIK